MCDYSVPLLLVTAVARSAIEINGSLIGEASPQKHVAFPLSTDCDCYISIIPLENIEQKLLYSITRKISIESGRIVKNVPDDVFVTEWPGGVIEVCASPGSIDRCSDTVFPYIISSIELKNEDKLFTLYYDNGLRIVMERKGVQICGRALGCFCQASLYSILNGASAYCVVKINTNGEERIVVFDSELNALLDATGDGVGFIDAVPYTIRRLDKIIGHEEMCKYTLSEGKFIPDKRERGFFTHEANTPNDEISVATAFCEAIRDRRDNEARSFLSQELADADMGEISDILGRFSGIKRSVIAREETTIGLISEVSRNHYKARLLRFEFEDMRISNIKF